MEQKKNLFIDILQTLALAFAVFMTVYLFLVQPHQVDGDSMYPTFHNGEYLLTEKVSYYLHKPERGDIIVFEAPPNPDKDFIKRIIGLPGETVLIKDGQVFINGKKLSEPYLPAYTYTTEGTFQEITLKPEEYFVMGDNRPSSSDSRSWGPVKRDKIVGKAWFVYWPPNRIRFVKDIEY